MLKRIMIGKIEQLPLNSICAVCTIDLDASATLPKFSATFENLRQ